VSLLASVVAVALARNADAAELAVSGADGCFDAPAIADQVADLLGRPLASVTGVDFEVTLARAPSSSSAAAAAWKLRLDTIDGGDAGHERRSRELTADSCAELADAAAVAIAMTVRSRAAAEPAPPRRPPAPVAPPPPSAPASVVSRTPALTPSAPMTFAGGVAVVGDGGALPQAGIGVELGASLRHRRVRLTVAGTALAPQVAHTTGDVGGEFRLLFGSAQVCLPTAVGRMTLLGCGGYELGRLSAEGVGVLRPQLGSTRWQAARAELGLAIPVAARLAVVMRGGVAIPLSRTRFVVDGGTPVHRPGSVAVRLALGAELEF
jgi:hypothetical protein